MVFTYIPMWKPLVCRLENDQKISTFLGLPGGFLGSRPGDPGEAFQQAPWLANQRTGNCWRRDGCWQVHPGCPSLFMWSQQVWKYNMIHQEKGHTHILYIYIWKATYSVYCHHLSHALSQYNNVSLHKATSCPDPADFGKMTTRQHKISFRDILKGLLGRKPQ